VSYTQAVAEALRLRYIMNKHGITCSIELQEGRGPDPWAVPTKYHRMHHHTVSRYVPGGNLTPVLGVCKVGRPDVPGPLCNGYGGYDKVYRIICMGLANHPGAGGPITIDGVHIPQDSARGPTWGTEWEGGLQTWEEIGQLGVDMLQFMGRADNALAEWSGRPLTSQMEHSTWAPDRKIDRLHFDRARGIALTQQWQLTMPPPVSKEEGMHLVQFGGDNRWYACGPWGRIWLTEGFPTIWVKAHLQKGSPCYFEGSPDNPGPLQWHESIKLAYPPVRPEDSDSPPAPN